MARSDELGRALSTTRYRFWALALACALALPRADASDEVLAESDSVSVITHYLRSVQIGPAGELLVQGDMGAMLSRDGGEHWQLSPWRQGQNTLDALGPLPWARAADAPAAPVRDVRGRLYRCEMGGVELSDNGGADWIPAPPLDRSQREAIHVKNGRVSALDINGHGVWLTSVEEIRQWLSGAKDTCGRLAVGGHRIYALGERALYWSEDRGREWRGGYHEFPEEKSATPGHLLLADTAGRVYMEGGTQPQPGQYRQVIFTNAGHSSTWTQPDFGLPAGDTGNMKPLFTEGRRLYFMVETPDTEKGDPYRQTLYRSEDAGPAEKLLEISRNPDMHLYSWRHGGGMERTDYVASGPAGELVVVSDRSVFISRDDGRSWTEVPGEPLWKEELPQGFHYFD